MRLLVLVLATVAGFTCAPFAAAQPDPPHVVELRFVNELRKRGDAALAMDYLQRLGKDPSPELAKELPFEIAKTRLAVGTEEPETGKRLALYQQARKDFEDFLAKNAGSPRAAEARMEIAHVAVLQGKTQLAKALTDNDVKEAVVARTMLIDAGKQMAAAAADLDAQLKKTPEADKAARKKLEGDLLQAELNQALNLYDQARTYLDTGMLDTARQRDDAMEAAAAALEKVADKDNGSIGWQAAAWLGRCQQQLGKPNDARKTLAKLIAFAPTPANADARRLARYFILLLPKADGAVKEADHIAAVIKAAREWLRDYPRHHATPEGYGVRYALAANLIAQADARPNAAANLKQQEYGEARELLKALEHSENEFTDRARRQKIALIERQGGFKLPVEQLKTFDDCFVRAQYEHYMIAKDIEAAKDPKEREAKVKARHEAAMKALEVGLTKPDAKPDAKGKYSFEVNNARLSLAYAYLQNGRHKEAFQAAEAIARADVRASQAPTAAAYAMQAAAQYLAEREQKVASPDELKADRDRFLEFAKFAEEAWPDALPGNLARHQVGLLLLRQKQLGEAIKKLNSITPTYPEYVQVKNLVAEVCLTAEKEKREPLKDPELPGSYAEIALKTLLSVPDSMLGSPDPAVNHAFFLNRIRIGQEYFKAKKFAEMEQLAQPLRAKVTTLRLAADEERNAQLQRDIGASLADILVYARFGLADAEFKEKRYAKVAELLGPIVADINADKLPQIKNNPQLSTALLSLTLKAAVHLNNLEQTQAVLAAMQKTAGDAEGNATLLLQLVDLIQTQIDDLNKKGDKDALARTKKAYQQILAEVDKSQKKKTPEFMYLLAKNYSSLDEHEKAADLLSRVEPPQPTGMKEADDKADAVYHTVFVAYIHELRLSGEKDKAKKLLEDILGPPAKPGWGASHVEAQLEKVLTLEDEKKFAAAAKVADQWVDKLKAKAESDLQVREKYLEFYYHTAYSFYKFGVATREKGDKAKGDKAVREAAIQLAQLEKTWKGFGTEASTKRIEDLLAAEPELKAQFEAQKKK
jgi:hypothetical protein